MALTRQDVESGLAELIKKQTHTKLNLIDGLKLRGSLGLGLDSIDILDLSSAIQEKYELEIPDEEIQELKTYGQLIDYIFDKKRNH